MPRFKAQNKSPEDLSCFSIEDILLATSGTLLQGAPRARVRGISIDTRTIGPKELFLAIKGNNFDGHNFIATAIKKSAAGLVISQKQSISFPADLPVILVKDTSRALGDIARFHRKRFKIPLIAITGSNGKTTAKEMVAAVLQTKFSVLKNEGTQNNHIGVPLTLLKLNARHQAVVLEFGTNHPGEISYLTNIALPAIAIITNIGPAHLEFFKTIPSVFREKRCLLGGLNKGGVAVLNSDDSFLGRIKNKDYQIITFGIKNKSNFQASNILRNRERLNFTVNHRHKIALNTPAPHNIYNALLAIACGKLLRLSYGAIKSALAKFQFPPGRMEIKSRQGIKIIDDTYNANPASFQSAVEVLTGYNSKCRKIIVCGDMKELGVKSSQLHFSLGEYIGKSGIDRLITIGKMARLISWGAQKVGMDKNRIYQVNSISQVCRRLQKMIHSSDIVLIKGSRAMGMEAVIEKLFRG